MHEIVLENRFLIVSFDENTGALTRMRSKATGWDIQRRSALGESFHMLTPLPDRRNNPVLGEKQEPPDVQKDIRNKRIIFAWEKLRSEHGGVLDIAFKGVITLTDDGLVFEAEVDNRSSLTVENIGWPCLGDLSRPLGAKHFKWMSMSGGGAGQSELFPVFRCAYGYWGVDYPAQSLPATDMPFVLVAADGQGLYAGYHDITLEHLVRFWFSLRPGYEQSNGLSTGNVPDKDEIDGQPVHITFSAEHLPFFGPGESGRLHPVVLQPYAGTWHKGADCYKKWRKTWFTAPAKPTWVTKVHAWQQIHINSPEGELRCRYTDLVQYGRDCRKYGIKAIQLVGWTRDGQDGGNPSHDIDPRLGTWEDLRAAIAEIQDMGVKVVLFNKYTWADRSTEEFRKDLIRYAVKDVYQDYYMHHGFSYQTVTQLSDLNTRRFVPMCPCCEDWREAAKTEFRKSIDLGASGMLYDECLHHGGARYCFDPAHGHRVPTNIYAGDHLLARDFHRVSDAAKPDYLYAGELCCDSLFRYYHLSYFRIDESHVPMHRYVNPDSEMMIAVTGHNDRNVINLALLYRYIISYEPRFFKGRLEEFPRTLEYGRKVDALRRRYSEYLWNVEFRHTVGAQVKAEGRSLQSYSVFRNPESGRRAVVVANLNHEEPIDVRIWLEPRVSRLLLATPEAPDLQAADETVQLPPLSVAVLLEQSR